MRGTQTNLRALLRSALAALMMLVTVTSAAAEVGCTMNAMAVPTTVAGDRNDGAILFETVVTDDEGAPSEPGTFDCASNCVLQWTAAPTSSTPHSTPAPSRQPYQPAASPPLHTAGPVRTERPPQA